MSIFLRVERPNDEGRVPLSGAVAGQAVWPPSYGSGVVTSLRRSRSDDSLIATVAFEGTGDITLQVGGLRQIEPPLVAVIDACEAGWFDLALTSGTQTSVDSFSAACDPLPSLLAPG